MQIQTARVSFSKWKPIEIMLSVLFLIAPFYFHLNIGGSGFKIPNNVAIWLVALIIIWYSFNKALKGKNYYRPETFIYVLTFPVLITLSGFIIGIDQSLNWLVRLLFLWGGLAFFFGLYQHKLSQARYERLIFIVAISAVFHSVFGIIQIWLDDNMTSLLPITRSGLPEGFFQQINNHVTYQATAILLSFYLLTRPVINKSKAAFYTLILVVTCGSFTIGISGSRVGLLSLFIGITVIFPSIWQYQKGRKSILALLCVLVISFSTGIFLGKDRLNDKVQAMGSGLDGNIRLVIYNVSLDLISQKPLLGHGVGSFAREWQHAKIEFYEENPNAVKVNGFVAHPHNELILWLVEGGYVALVGIIVFLVGFFISLKKAGKKRGLIYFSFFIPIGLHTQVEFPFHTSALHWMLFLFLIAFIMNHSIQKHEIKLSNAANRTATIALPAIAFVLLLSILHTLWAQWDFVHYYKKTADPRHPFKTALVNPYLAESARWIDMNTLLYESIKQELKQNVEIYTDWAENLQHEQPKLILYIHLMDAYRYLDKKEDVCRNLVKATKIYPGTNKLANYQQFCKN